MKYLLPLVCFFFASVSFSQKPATPPLPAPKLIDIIKQTHDATYHIGQETITDGAICSATAIGPHALLTATHCELPEDELEVEEIDDPLTIKQRIRDGFDHTIYIVNADFDIYVKVNEKDEKAQGEDVFFFGNPGKYHDVYRKGYITTVDQNKGFFGDGPKKILFDMNGWMGDSGSGIFNSAGEVIGTVTGASFQKEDDDTFKLMVSYVLQFKQQDLDDVYKGKTNVKVIRHKDSEDKTKK